MVHPRQWYSTRNLKTYRLSKQRRVEYSVRAGSFRFSFRPFRIYSYITRLSCRDRVRYYSIYCVKFTSINKRLRRRLIRIWIAMTQTWELSFFVTRIFLFFFFSNERNTLLYCNLLFPPSKDCEICIIYVVDGIDEQNGKFAKFFLANNRLSILCIRKDWLGLEGSMPLGLYPLILANKDQDNEVLTI